MSDAEKALEDFTNGTSKTGAFGYILATLKPETVTAITRALKIAAAVDGDGLEMKGSNPIEETDIERGNNDLLERLRGIK